jgi:hypothetical protein
MRACARNPPSGRARSRISGRAAGVGPPRGRGGGIGVVMLLYVNQAVTERQEAGRLDSRPDFVGHCRGRRPARPPVATTVAVIIAVGLLPIMWGSGTGSEVMRRIAAPMVGGMVTATLLTTFVVQVASFCYADRAAHLGKSRSCRARLMKRSDAERSMCN